MSGTFDDPGAPIDEADPPVLTGLVLTIDEMPPFAEMKPMENLAGVTWSPVD
jgi:hypothetical protein